MARDPSKPKLETAYLLKQTRRRPWGLIVLTVILVAAAAGGMWWYLLR